MASSIERWHDVDELGFDHRNQLRDAWHHEGIAAFTPRLRHASEGIFSRRTNR
ncbi:hypothetical protein [Luteibacter sp. 329MFSha]|uniref:hypothetical protein n=1 Tax=Luteibacter sp. 329MFSha TaxID=1798239 RepID=UPI001587C0EC|nr:hypothetical protein [Luteibacter sp. 329MFSha]